MIRFNKEIEADTELISENRGGCAKVSHRESKNKCDIP